MPAKWQTWMPFHIDRFRGSPDVGVMHPCARAGYLYLLASAWQTDDCSLSPDALDLATASGLGDELWQVHGPRILRKFQSREDGRLVNPALLCEWSEARRVFDSRRVAAQKTNDTRSPHGDRLRNVENTHFVSRSADTRTETETVTETKEQNPSPPPAATAVVTAKPARQAKEPDPRHAAFRAALGAYWAHKNPGDVEMPWHASDAKGLASLLQANPALGLASFQGLLRHRARSDVNHSERLRAWLPAVTNYANGPLNQFGKPKETGRPDAAVGMSGQAHAPLSEAEKYRLRMDYLVRVKMRNDGEWKAQNDRTQREVEEYEQDMEKEKA